MRRKKTGGGSRKGIKNKATKELRDIIEEAISTRERMDLLAQLARGVTVKEEKKSGPVIYTTPPSDFAIRQLNEYQYGKPRQQLEVTGKDGASFEITIGSRTAQD